MFFAMACECLRFQKYSHETVKSIVRCFDAEDTEFLQNCHIAFDS